MDPEPLYHFILDGVGPGVTLPVSGVSMPTALDATVTGFSSSWGSQLEVFMTAILVVLFVLVLLAAAQVILAVRR